MSRSTVTTNVTAKQFMSFETISAIAFGLFVTICAWTWTNRVSVVDGRFERVEAKIDKVESKIEKVEQKQDQMVLTLARIEAKMVTKDDLQPMSRSISDNEKSIGILTVKVEHLEN